MKNAHILFLMTIFILLSFLPGITYAASSVSLTGGVDWISPDSVDPGDGLTRTLDIGTDTVPITLEISWSANFDIENPKTIEFNSSGDSGYLFNDFILTIGNVVIDQDISHSESERATATFILGELVGFELFYFDATIPGYPGSDWVISISGSIAGDDITLSWEIFDESSAIGDWIKGHLNFEDRDQDGFYPAFEISNNTRLYDCNDENATINPSGYDFPFDGIDQDCSGSDYICADAGGGDADGDGICDAFDGDDTDGDGFTDAREVVCESDPADPDSKCSVALPFLFLLLE